MKVIEKIKGFLKWVNVDGGLHALANYSIMLAAYPMFKDPGTGIVVAFLAAILASIGKEVYDMFSDGCSIKNAWHDLLCDALGMGCAVLTWLLWWLFSIGG